MQLQSDYYPLILKKDLVISLNLKINHIDFLIEKGYIKTKLFGRKEIVSNLSLHEFKSFFNRDNYYTKSETIQILTENGFYAEYVPHIKMYTLNIEKYPYTYQLFKKNKELDVFTIDKTDFIRKESLNVLLTKLQNIREVDERKLEEDTKKLLISYENKKNSLTAKSKNKRVKFKK